MKKLGTKQLIYILDKLVYIVFLILSIYLIYKANVIQRFRLARTNFAEYDETVTELPTLITYIDNFEERSRLKYGVDFNLSFGELESLKPTNLTFGENWMTGSSLKVDFEEINNGGLFKITPEHFSQGMPLSYSLTYIFQNYILDKATEVSLLLSSENNSIILDPSRIKYHDGDVKKSQLKLGYIRDVSISPRKYIFLKGQRACRDKPYNELLLRNISKELLLRCQKPCRTNVSYGRRLDMILDGYSYCQKKEEEKCFQTVFDEVVKIGEDQDIKPCTKVEYKVERNMQNGPKTNEAKFKMVYSHPPKVQVKEEYLIYDTLALVSSIGGTMGICIGVSFYNVLNVLLTWLELIPRQCLCLKSKK